MHRIRRGLDLPISGAPEQRIHTAPAITRVALLGDDTPGLRARLAVEEGEVVKRGQLLFEDRTRPGVRYTAPGAGRVAAVFRGARRMLRSVVIQLSEGERAGAPPERETARFESHPTRDSEALDGAGVRALLLESGLWTALRSRPYSKPPEPETTPYAFFVNAMDTQPLAADPEVVIAAGREDFERGLRAVVKLCPGITYLCVGPGSVLAQGVDAPVSIEIFSGPHPSGTVGVHIHQLAPVGRQRSVWHIGYQDVMAIGRLLESGRLPVGRVISLAGPSVRSPRLVRSRLGASTEEHSRGELEERPGREIRLVAGSVLAGKKAMGPEFGFLGRYHLQLSALEEGGERHLLGWAAPGSDRYSVLPVFASRLLRRASFAFNTDTHGSRRALMPIGTYERVMPMDIIATYLLRALVVGDTEQAEKLGALELDEEDLSLCTFVCPGKTDFGPYLRRSLESIEKEG
ncbi:MAG: Na(+)-translocating NADH-quinone reductase subunit A [Deltaproteobacteria bacterium]|nr:Na(+)-translocating NADH-quinone reductase subunit A [Deltaproteobacteria bacterium]MBW2447881.1 Na(+)-translocating NADH-quinone reductase subunit A [Deltaproteobacteria bacterium]